MQTEVTFKAELSVPGERIMHHLRLYNDNMEQEIQDGIDAAMKEIDIKEVVKQGILRDFQSTIWSACMSRKSIALNYFTIPQDNLVAQRTVFSNRKVAWWKDLVPPLLFKLYNAIK